MSASWSVIANRVIEFSFSSSLPHADPFNDLELDVVFEGPGGSRRVPAFWAGGQEWRVRFSAVQPGRYSFHSQCSDPNDNGLHGQLGMVEVHPVAEGEVNPLYRCGGLRVARNVPTCSTRTVRLFSGWAIPGGWLFAGGWGGLRIFRR